MKFTTVASAALLFSGATIGMAADQKTSHLVANNIGNFAKTLKRQQTKVLEKLADPTALQAKFQARDLKRDFDGEEFFQLLEDECPDEFAALQANFLDPQAFVDLIECVKAAFIAKLEQCLAGFEGILEPVQCLIDLAPDEDITLDLGLSDSDNDFTKGRVLDNDDSASDSAGNFESKLFDMDDVDVSELDAQDCAQIFGTANAPDFFACLTLLDSADWDAFKAALKKNFQGIAACNDFVALAGLKQSNSDGKLDFFEEFFGELDYFDDFDFDLCSQNVLDDALENYQAVFDQCSQFDNGALESQLQAQFGSGVSTTSYSFVGIIAAIAATIRAF